MSDVHEHTFWDLGHNVVCSSFHHINTITHISTSSFLHGHVPELQATNANFAPVYFGHVPILVRPLSIISYCTTNIKPLWKGPKLHISYKDQMLSSDNIQAICTAFATLKCIVGWNGPGKMSWHDFYNQI